MSRFSLESAPSATEWLRQVQTPSSALLGHLREIYGADAGLLEERRALHLRVLESFLSRFGDGPVRLFRSPGRINLRGMHVDTHGGYLNLMTHQREVVVAARPANDSACVFTNIDANYPEVTLPAMPGPADGPTFAAGHWGNYLEGVLLMAPIPARTCWRATVGSDLSTGSGISSSHALCVAVMEMAAALSGAVIAPDAKILAARAAEWHTGARTGVSDQTPMLLGRRGMLLNAALLAEDLDLSGVRHVPFPEALRVLVVDSRTKRNLSGAAQTAYTKNRFAYSAALELFKRACRGAGIGTSRVADFDRFSRITPERLGGNAALLRLLQRVPEAVSLEDLPADGRIEEAYTRFFGHLSEAQRPTHFEVRGPLIFGLAESERARRFPDLLTAGDYEGAGALMTLGHAGDRILDHDGAPYACALDGDALARLADADTPLAQIPGAYGASSPALDGIVDAALEAGALGASLTGAGIAGSVLALCRAEKTEHIAAALSRYLATEAYAQRRGAEPMDPDYAQAAVVVNHPVAAAGELTLDARSV